MKRRSRTSLVSQPVLIVFLATVVVPRPGLFFHEHTGGERFHVHAEDPDAEVREHDREHHQHHAHDAHAVGAETHQVEIEATDSLELGHWPTQSPFHPAVAPAAQALQSPFGTVAAPADSGRGIVEGRALLSHARGPPPPYHA